MIIVYNQSKIRTTPLGVRFLLALIPFMFGFMVFLSEAEAFHSCPENQLIGNDLIGIDALVNNGNLFIYAFIRDTFGGIIMPSTSTQFDFYIDADQNSDTGDIRPGTIAGIDYRVNCQILINESPVCNLYTLPTEYPGDELFVAQVQAKIVDLHTLMVSIPTSFDASDVIAFAHGGTDFYSGKTGNGDRCPEEGAFDTATRDTVIRHSPPHIDQIISAVNGSDLEGWRFQTHGDQFRIEIDYKYLVNALSEAFSGRLELDTDRNMETGLVQTPFLIPSPFNEIPSWGWDVAIEYMGGAGIASDPTPFSLDFGTQSIYIIPPEQTYAYPYYFPFGEGYNDGRWWIWENNVVLEGSLSLLDARQWQIVPGSGLNIERISTDGKVMGRLFTRYFSQIRDILPGPTQAFDTGTGSAKQAIEWHPEKMVTGYSPIDRTAQNDFIQVDAQIDGDNLIVRGILARLESSWNINATRYIIFLDTDGGSSGIPIHNEEYNTEIILADHSILIDPMDLYGHIGYRMNLVTPAGIQRGCDSGLNIRFSEPYEANSPARLVATIPLANIGHPQQIRLYFASYDIQHSMVDDVAPQTPLILTTVSDSGDTDHDGDTDGLDLHICLNEYAGHCDCATHHYCHCDFNKDGVVDNADVHIFSQFFGMSP